MKKAIIHVGYTQYVLDTQKALAILEILSDAEIYEDKWRKQEEGGTTYHIYPQEEGSEVKTMKIIPMGFYNMAKLAGRPVKGN